MKLAEPIGVIGAMDFRLTPRGNRGGGRQIKIYRGERALRRAARKARTENRRFGLPLVVWKNSRTGAISA